jgi:hypothetical protein
MRPTELTLLVGPGGWLQADVTDATQRLGQAFIRFTRDNGHRWQPIARFELSPTDASARAVSLRRVTLAANANDAVSNALASRLNEHVEPLGTAGFLLSFSDYAKSERVSLKRPPGRRLDNDWYANVAAVYRDAVARGENPRSAIMDAAGVSSDLAGRWVYQARQRGLLAKTNPGQVPV